MTSSKEIWERCGTHQRGRMWKTWGEAEVVRKVQSPILPPFRGKSASPFGDFTVCFHSVPVYWGETSDPNSTSSPKQYKTTIITKQSEWKSTASCWVGRNRRNQHRHRSPACMSPRGCLRNQTHAWTLCREPSCLSPTQSTGKDTVSSQVFRVCVCVRSLQLCSALWPRGL